MNSDTDPIYYFPKLRKCLTDMGIEIGQAGAWHPVGTINVLPEDIGERILFEDDCIFYIDDKGVKRRGFMYKAAFYFEWQGRVNQPKFHVYKCAAIEEFGHNAYRFANAEPVKIYSRNACRELEIKGMELCKRCKDMLMEKKAKLVNDSTDILMDKKAKLVNDSTDFVRILKKASDVEESAECDVDIFGYVKNWEEISFDYREKQNFTCERCHTHIEDSFDHHYMQTHHKNGVKTDNQEGNLECLCVKCHSEVNDVHRRNFSSAAQKIIIDEYMRKYHGKPNDFISSV